jgi:hypothetical protein
MNLYLTTSVIHFYIFPEDLGDEPLFYECKYLKKLTIRESQQEVWLIKVHPRLPKWLDAMLPRYESDLLGLGTIDSSWSLKRIGDFGFIVDVYVVKEIALLREETPLNGFIKFGTAIVSETGSKPRLMSNL